MSRTSLKRARTSRRVAVAVSLSIAALLFAAAPAGACSWDYPIWIPRHKNADALYRFIRDGKAGYIDRTGKVVIEPKFEPRGNYGGEFHDGLAEVGVDSGEYVDSTGRPLNLKLYRGWDFSDGLAAALAEDNGKWGYIDRTGKFAISPRFEGYPKGYVSSFSEGLAWIQSSGKYGFIDRSGEFVVAPSFIHGEDFHEGMALVVVEGPCSHFSRSVCGEPQVLGDSVGQDGVPGCKVTFVDSRGSLLEARFDAAKDFSEGLAPVMKGGKWGYIDKSGRVRIEPRFDDAWPFESGRARVLRGGLYGYIDERGEFAVTPRFETAEDFSEGLAVVAGKEPGDDARHSFYYIDRDGRAVIRGPFYNASRFFKGLAHVELKPSTKEGDEIRWSKRRFAYIDAKGKTVFAYEYEETD
jgi:hypothetical protein